MKPPLVAALSGALFATSVFVIARFSGWSTAIDWSSAQRIEIRMIEYEFVPNQLRFRRGLPYQLHLVNAGKEAHDFTAPDFFASVQVKNTDGLNESGTSVFLQPGQTIDIYFIAQNARLFAPRCADHDWAGMKATIVID